MQTLQHVNLSEHTFFETGGPAATFINIEDSAEILEVLQSCNRPIWFLGSGANVLVSDKGLQGTTIHLATSDIVFEGQQVIADAGVIWDDLVVASIEHSYWGLERTSGVPGSVGAAVVGNIAAYGQAASETIAWVEVIDVTLPNPKVTRLQPADLDFSYRMSNFQQDDYKKYLITRVAFQLQTEAKPLEYASALRVAEELKLDHDDLHKRREVVLETRRRIGALADEAQKERTAGSFFRNPLVSAEQAERIMGFEEHSISADEIKRQNKLHGGSAARISAAHVLLAAGFKRGQSWGPVRLHPDHILKLENTGGASSQNIYNVAQEIITTVKETLDIDLQPEVRFLGLFDQAPTS
jgi:UDP-N-acetylmuramate dehydrogenase